MHAVIQIYSDQAVIRMFGIGSTKFVSQISPKMAPQRVFHHNEYVVLETIYQRFKHQVVQNICQSNPFQIETCEIWEACRMFRAP